MFRATGRGPFEGALPMVPGNGVGGAVAAVGAGVDPALVGRRVVTSTGGAGGYAEKVAVDAASLVPVPDGLALDVAVALLADGRTATMLVDAAGVRGGDRVLVEAAAGGVGTLIVQLAHAAGARVIGAAGGERKLALATSLGADTAIDYTEPGWERAAGPVDVVFDGVGGAIARAAFGLLGHGGRMVSFGLASGTWSDVSEQEAAERGVTRIGLQRPDPAASRAFTARALAAAAEGRLRPVIGACFPLACAAEAHAAIEARATVGKTLLQTGLVP